MAPDTDADATGPEATDSQLGIVLEQLQERVAAHRRAQALTSSGSFQLAVASGALVVDDGLRDLLHLSCVDGECTIEHLLSRFDRETRAVLREAIREAQQAKGTVHRTVAVPDNDAVHTVDVRLQPLRDPEGRVTQVFGVVAAMAVPVHRPEGSSSSGAQGARPVGVAGPWAAVAVLIMGLLTIGWSYSVHGSLPWALLPTASAVALGFVAYGVARSGRAVAAANDAHHAFVNELLSLRDRASVLELANDHGVVLHPDSTDRRSELALQVLARLDEDLQNERTRQSMADSQARSRVLLSLSHQLRTPLAGITGAASTLVNLGERVEPDQRNELCERIVQETRRMDLIVDKVLRLGNLSADDPDLDLQWEVPAEAVMASVSAARRKHEITYTDDGKVWLALVDAALLRVLVDTLIENAVVHGASEEPTEVALERHGDTFAVWVRDRGVGFAGSMVDATDSLRTRMEGGMELGLATCQAIVAAHGGSLEGRQREDGGSEWVARLPNGGPEGLPSPSIPDMLPEPHSD